MYACSPDIQDVIIYLSKTGVQWRLLPKEFPPWKTVYDHYSQWNRRGIWGKSDGSIELGASKKNGKNTTPSYGLIDSQSVK